MRDADAIRLRAFELSQGPDAGTPDEDWIRAERELTVAHDYDTLDFDLERLGITVSRVPLEAGVTWQLRLPRGEVVEAWEPGNAGLAPPPEIANLIAGVLGGRELLPMPPASSDEGAARLREMIDLQRQGLLAHDPGTRVGDDPENLHQHRVAARRTRAYLHSVRRHVDADWYRSLVEPLRELGDATGPVRDLDVLLEYLRIELETLDVGDRAGGAALTAQLAAERDTHRARLLEALDADSYRRLLRRLRPPPRLAEGVATISLERIARKAFHRLAGAVDELGSNPDDATLHRLRIALKRARYAAELWQPCGRKGERFFDDAKRLQDVLGEYQDAVVTERRLRSASVVDSATAAAFVAGRIAERQRLRRKRARKHLPKAWRRLRASSARLR